MSEDVAKRTNRRRRRPDRGNRRPADAPAAGSSSPGSEKGPEPQANAGGGRPNAGGGASGGANASAGGSRPGGGGRREEPRSAVLHRRSDRRRGDRPGADSGPASVELHPGLTPVGRNRAANEEPITPINKDIFIYTYTLRPRTLLDNYQPSAGITHRMQYENQDEPS